MRAALARAPARPRPLLRRSAALAVSLLRIAALGLVLTLAASGCSRPGGGEAGVQIEIGVEPQPPAVGVVALDVRLRDDAGRPLAADGVSIEGTMTHPGMQPTFATARRVDTGRWTADLELTMGGDWIVIVEARLADGRAVRRELPLPAVESR